MILVGAKQVEFGGSDRSAAQDWSPQLPRCRITVGRIIQRIFRFTSETCGPQDAIAIAKALSNHGSSAPRLRSFSINYNRALSDEGATILLAALPLTLNALGTVECDLSDESGRTLLDWGQHATGLQMMCVEGNRFSPAMRQRLAGLGQAGSTSTVFA